MNKLSQAFMLSLLTGCAGVNKPLNGQGADVRANGIYPDAACATPQVGQLNPFASPEGACIALKIGAKTRNGAADPNKPVNTVGLRVVASDCATIEKGALETATDVATRIGTNVVGVMAAPYGAGHIGQGALGRGSYVDPCSDQLVQLGAILPNIVKVETDKYVTEANKVDSAVEKAVEKAGKGKGKKAKTAEKPFGPESVTYGFQGDPRLLQMLGAVYNDAADHSSRQGTYDRGSGSNDWNNQGAGWNRAVIAPGRHR